MFGIRLFFFLDLVGVFVLGMEGWRGFCGRVEKFGEYEDGVFKIFFFRIVFIVVW